MEEAKAIFIAGHSRSGTTLVNNIVKAHPQIAGGYQTRLFRHFYDIFHYSETRNRDRGIYSFHKDTLFLYELVKKFVNEYYEAFARRQNKQFFVEKTPSQELNFPLIKYCFPTAKVIYCLRDGRDVWLSHLELSRHNPAWKEAAIITDVAKTWSESVNICFDQTEFDRHHFLIVRFEQLIHDSLTVIERVFKFLEAGTEEVSIEKIFKIVESNPNVEQFEEYTPGFSGKWKTHMSDSEKQIFKDIGGKTLIRAGYETDFDW